MADDPDNWPDEEPQPAEPDAPPPDVEAGYTGLGEEPPPADNVLPFRGAENAAQDGTEEIQGEKLLEIENAWLGIALSSQALGIGTAVVAASQQLSPDCFTAPLNRLVFEAIRISTDAGEPPDPVVLHDTGMPANAWDHVIALISADYGASNFERYTGLLVGQHQRRRRIVSLTGLGKALERAAKGTASTDVILEAMRQRIGELERNLAAPESTTRFPTDRAAEAIAMLGDSPVSWRIHGYLEQESVAVMFGAPGALKSTVAVDLACCIATGREWHGHQTTRGWALYIAGERRRGVLRRIEAWARYHDVPLDNLDVHVSRTAAALMEESSAADIAATIQALSSLYHGDGPALVIFDTLSRNFGAGSENETEAMATVVRNLDVYLRERFHCAVLIIHHVGQADRSRARGNSALQAAVDFEFKMVRNLDDDTVELGYGKPPADFEQPDNIVFEPRIVELEEVDQYGNARTSIIVETTDHTDVSRGTTRQLPLRGRPAKAYQLLEQLYAEHRARATDDGLGEVNVLLTDWRDACYADDIFNGPEKRKRFSESKATLLDRGLIRDYPPFVAPTRKGFSGPNGASENVR